jgi:hypothetical protein
LIGKIKKVAKKKTQFLSSYPEKRGQGKGVKRTAPGEP